MNKEDLLNKIEALEKQFNKQLVEIKEQVNSINSERCKARTKPACGDKYHFLHSDGRIGWAYWSNDVIDLFRFDTGNCFKTAHESNEYRNNLLTKQALKDLALELNNGVEIDWNDCSRKYFICLRGSEDVLTQYYNIYDNCDFVMYCLDENFLDIAKERIGKEKLIKLIKSGV